MLVVGIEKYDAGSGWDVDGPAGAARRFVDWLRTDRVPDDNILLFLSPLDGNRELLKGDGPAAQPATEQRILEALTGWFLNV